MQIKSSNLQTNYKYTHPSFGDCAIKQSGDKLVTHFTHLGRDLRINRQRLADYAFNMIKNPKLGCEFIFCGCSDGSEIFDIMMAVVYKFYKEKIPHDKLPKFKAFDLSQKMIDIAKTGRINISNAGIQYVKESYPDYPFWINQQGIMYYPDDNIPYLERKIGSPIKNSYQFNPKLLEKIDFYRGSMLSEFQKIDSDSCKIVVCRNAARYNPESYQRESARVLDKNLKPHSLVIVGICDEYNPTDKDNNIIIDMSKGAKGCERLPFTDELFRNNFHHNEYLSPDHLIYQKNYPVDSSNIANLIY